MEGAEVDHRVPLFRVWSEHRETPWPDLLTYWGLPNLQVINHDVHAVKCAIEARDRRAARLAPAAYASIHSRLCERSFSPIGLSRAFVEGLMSYQTAGHLRP